MKAPTQRVYVNAGASRASDGVGADATIRQPRQGTLQPRRTSRAAAMGYSQPPERLLDRKFQSVSTFVSSGLDGGSSTGLDDAEWSQAMPQALLFPGNKPTSRADAVMLDKWVVASLANYAQRTSDREETREEDLSMAVEELVPILSIGLHEIVRQVTQHCLERGVVLEKLWRTYVELFERSLGETRAALKKHKQKTTKVEADLKRTEEELQALRTKHPQQLSKLSNTLASKFGQRREELQDQLDSLADENATLKRHLDNQAASHKSWFPNFDIYRHCGHRRTLLNKDKEFPSSKAPESALAADYKRILSTMPPDSRRRVGFFVSSLLGLRSSLVTVESVEGLTERRDHNKWKIEQLESHLQKLREGGQGAP